MLSSVKLLEALDECVDRTAQLFHRIDQPIDSADQLLERFIRRLLSVHHCTAYDYQVANSGVLLFLDSALLLEDSAMPSAREFYIDPSRCIGCQSCVQACA